MPRGRLLHMTLWKLTIIEAMMAIQKMVGLYGFPAVEFPKIVPRIIPFLSTLVILRKGVPSSPYERESDTPFACYEELNGAYSAIQILTRFSSIVLNGCTVSPLWSIVIRWLSMPLSFNIAPTDSARFLERRSLISALPVCLSA